MNSDLATTGSTALVNVEAPPPAPIRCIAATAEEMAVAQGGLLDWAQSRLEQARRDELDAENNLTTARASGFKSQSFSRARRRAQLTVEYYEKIQAAIEAGYLIIPDLPIDIFAIRTVYDYPDRQQESRSTWRNSLSEFAMAPEAPPMGEGKWIDKLPSRRIWKETYEKDGKTDTRFVAAPTNFAEVDFPIALATPHVMTLTKRAMTEKFFDEIGGLPERRTRKGDPIVVGRILRPITGTRVAWGLNPGVSFLIAWWVDTRQL